ncbi:MAG: hypothetical protein HQK61_01385, partial [Desulfamplus sp.]|nr:hypothetical protein [Desulfamplus sp.]
MPLQERAVETIEVQAAQGTSMKTVEISGNPGIHVKTIEVQGSQGISKIHVGESIKNVANYLPEGKEAVIITDENVKKWYEPYFP